MRLELAERKPTQPLADDYIHRFPRVGKLFEYDPWDEREWARRASDTIRAEQESGGADAPLRADRAALADALAAYNRRAGNTAEALAAIERLRDRETLVVAGGQQAGLFGGPLYNVYKAVTIIRSARDASRMLGRPVIPVFWIAGEDHDWDEVNHLYYRDGDAGGIRRLKLDPGRALPRTAVSRLALDAETWRKALEGIDEALVDSERKRGLLEMLRTAAVDGASLSDAYARIMAWLFGSHGLVLIDSDDPGIRELEAPMFAALIERGEALSAAYMQGDADVRALGFTPQADVSENGLNLFVFEQDERILLYREGETYTDKRGSLKFTKRQLLDRACSEPQLFSNNVLTRPLMQQFLFPVLATVLGHGEIAYWGLTKRAFEQMGMKMPIIVPRHEFTLLEDGVSKHMERFGLTFTDVGERFGELRRAWLDQQDDVPLTERFAEMKIAFTAKYRNLIDLAGGLEQGLEPLGETNLKRILREIEYFESKALDARERKHAAELRRWDRIGESLFPLSKPQERVYNFFAYLNRFGNEWISYLLHEPMPVDGKHRILYV